MEGESEEAEFEVEKIMDHRDVNGTIFYLVKWCGFPNSDNTWEPRNGLFNCQEAIKEYHTSLSLGKKRKRVYKHLSEEVQGDKKSMKMDLTVSVDENIQSLTCMQRNQQLEQQNFMRIKSKKPDKKVLFDGCLQHTDAEAEEIVAANNDTGRIRFLVKWKNCQHITILPASEANSRFPWLVIKFYEDRIAWKSTKSW